MSAVQAAKHTEAPNAPLHVAPAAHGVVPSQTTVQYPRPSLVGRHESPPVQGVSASQDAPSRGGSWTSPPPHATPSAASPRKKKRTREDGG